MRRIIVRGLVAVALGLTVAVGTTAKTRDSDVKRWEDLQAHPVDYSTYEKRRADIAKENGAGALGPLALGLAGRSDIGDNPVIDDPKLKAAVEAMVRKLIPPGIVPPNFQIIIVDDLGIYSRLQLIPPDQAEDTLKALSDKLSADYGAAATPGGALVLRLGTLRATHTPDELNFLLGHEMAHLLYDHFKNEDREKRIKELAAAGLLVASIMSRQGAGDQAHSTVQASLALALVNAVLARQWDRKQEKEADELGVELAVDFGGYSPVGAYTVMQALEHQEQDRETALDQLCGPEHAPEHLIKSIFSSLTHLNLPQAGTNPNSPACQVRTNLLADLFDNHPPAKDRDDNLHQYIQKWFPEQEKRPAKPFKNSKGVEVDNFVAFASPDGDANRLALAYEGLGDVNRGDLAGARRILAGFAARGEKGTKLAPVLFLQYAVAKKEGKLAVALKFLDQATRTSQVYVEAFDLLAQEYETAHRWSDAATTIGRWLQSAPDDKLYPRLVADWREAKNDAKMQKALESCRQASSKIIELCEASADPEHARDSSFP